MKPTGTSGHVSVKSTLSRPVPVVVPLPQQGGGLEDEFRLRRLLRFPHFAEPVTSPPAQEHRSAGHAERDEALQRRWELRSSPSSEAGRCAPVPPLLAPVPVAILAQLGCRALRYLNSAKA